MKMKYIFFIIMGWSLLACDKRSNLINSQYWVAKQAGAYQVVKKTTVTLQNGVETDRVEHSYGDSFLVLQSIDGQEGTTYEVYQAYGSDAPEFVIAGPDGWNIEYDEKRLVFGYINSNGLYIPNIVLTVDNMGKKNQQWHYFTTNNNGTTTHTWWDIKRQ